MYRKIYFEIVTFNYPECKAHDHLFVELNEFQISLQRNLISVNLQRHEFSRLLKN